MMCQLKHDPTVIGRVLSDDQTPQRSLPHIKTIMLGIEAGAQLFHDVARGGIEADLLNR